MKIRSALNRDDVKRVLEVLAQNKDHRDLIFKLMIFEGFKVGEIVGSDNRKRADTKWVRIIPTFPGMRVEDLTGRGIRTKKGCSSIRKCFTKLVDT